MNLLTLNIIIALIWLGLSSQLGMASFIIGFITGFIILSLFQPLFSRDHYIIKVYKVLLFIYKFTQALIISNIDIIKAVLCMRKEDIHPNLIAIKTSDMTKKEVLILSHCITLTPGTTTIHIDDDYKSIIVHAFRGENPKNVIDSIENDLKKYIVGVFH